MQYDTEIMKYKEFHKLGATKAYIIRVVQSCADYDCIPFNEDNQEDDQLMFPRKQLYLSDSWFGSVKIA